MTDTPEELRAKLKKTAIDKMEEIIAKQGRPPTPDEQIAIDLMLKGFDGELPPEDVSEALKLMVISKIPEMHEHYGLRGSPDDWVYNNNQLVPESWIEARDTIAGKENIQWLVKSTVKGEDGKTYVRGQYLMHKDALPMLADYIQTTRFGNRKKH